MPRPDRFWRTEATRIPRIPNSAGEESSVEHERTSPLAALSALSTGFGILAFAGTYLMYSSFYSAYGVTLDQVGLPYWELLSRSVDLFATIAIAWELFQMFTPLFLIALFRGRTSAVSVVNWARLINGLILFVVLFLIVVPMDLENGRQRLEDGEEIAAQDLCVLRVQASAARIESESTRRVRTGRRLIALGTSGDETVLFDYASGTVVRVATEDVAYLPRDVQATPPSSWWPSPLPACALRAVANAGSGQADWFLPLLEIFILVVVALMAFLLIPDHPLMGAAILLIVLVFSCLSILR